MATELLVGTETPPLGQVVGGLMAPEGERLPDADADAAAGQGAAEEPPPAATLPEVVGLLVAAHAALNATLARVEAATGFHGLDGPFAVATPAGPLYGGEFGLAEDEAFRVVRDHALARLREQKRSLHVALTGQFGVAATTLSAASVARATAGAA